MPRRGSVLAFDFGTKRIGVAIGELELAQAHPLSTLHGESNDRRFAEIAALIEREFRSACLRRDVLFSTGILKKTGLRIGG